MTMTRRTFLLSSGVIVASPVLANALLRLEEHRDDRTSDANDIVLKIEGWSQGGDETNAVWINVGPSWRTAWR